MVIGKVDYLFIKSVSDSQKDIGILSLVSNARNMNAEENSNIEKKHNYRIYYLFWSKHFECIRGII